ncbi:hypothetical protein BpHYR1_010885, partial [Brachionus plicatilis]
MKMTNYRIRKQIIEHYARKNFIKKYKNKRDGENQIQVRLFDFACITRCSTLEHKSQNTDLTSGFL